MEVPTAARLLGGLLSAIAWLSSGWRVAKLPLPMGSVCGCPGGGLS